MPTHMLLSGEPLEFEKPTGTLAKYLEELRSAVDDPTITEAHFIELLYSADNPLLDPTIMPGRGTVTRAVFANPIYHLMIDLLGRKRVNLGTLDMDRVRERYSMTVADAATKLDVHESAIRQAIAAGRLTSVKDKGRHMLDPAQVDAFELRARGPTPALEVIFGSVPGKRLSIKHDGNLLEESREGTLTRGRIENWSAAKIITSAGPRARYWEIERGNDTETISLSPFSVKGRFKIVDKTNNAQEANAMFKEATPMPKGLRLKLVVASPQDGFTSRLAEAIGDETDPKCPGCGRRLKIRPAEGVNYRCSGCGENLLMAPQ